MYSNSSDPSTSRIHYLITILHQLQGQYSRNWDKKWSMNHLYLYSNDVQLSMKLVVALLLYTYEVHSTPCERLYWRCPRTDSTVASLYPPPPPHRILQHRATPLMTRYIIALKQYLLGNRMFWKCELNITSHEKKGHELQIHVDSVFIPSSHIAYL